MSVTFTESTVEEAALGWFAALGYGVLHGPEIAPGAPEAERDSFGEAVLPARLRAAIARLNPMASAEAQEEAYRRLLRRESPSLVADNQRFHRRLADGIGVEVRDESGRVRGVNLRLIDFDNPTANDWLVVNQFTVIEDGKHRRPDIVVFVNGLPLAVIELKDPTNEAATIGAAFNQLQTYKQEIPTLFVQNEVLVISDGIEARAGSMTSDRERFVPWKTIAGEDLAPSLLPRLQVLIEGLFEQRRLLDYLHGFVVFEQDGARLNKILAAYHQFHAVRHAVETTVAASRVTGDRRAGVVWHTQGSGKSLTMLFYAGRIVLHPALHNPTLVVITDRNDLDDQLYGTFARGAELLRQTPAQAADRDHLRELLRVASGGVIFTTIQKFSPAEKGERFPLLSDRRNIVVIADEAHRSQYDFVDGYARHLRDALPSATFIGFTGTPIDLEDRSTRAVFGDYISVYDIQRAIDDHTTVPIYYESRLAKLALAADEQPHLDEEFEELTEGEEEAHRERLKTKWAALEAVVGAGRRLELVAEDLVAHFERRQEALLGKGLIVGMSRRICVELYEAIIRLRPAWQSEDDAAGAIEVVMTGSAADPLAWQRHIRNKPAREALAGRFKDPDDALKLVIVRDMWLTGFDVPALHTMYIDKPMRGHALMQAIARVNRVFRDKPGGLVVDYLGFADQLKRALAQYTAGGGAGQPTVDQREAVAVLLEKYEIVSAFFHGFDHSALKRGTAAEKLAVWPAAQEHVLSQPDGKRRFLAAVSELSKAFALAVPADEALAIVDDLRFFQGVQAVLGKESITTRKAPDELDHAIRQLISQAIAPEGVVDIFAAAGLAKPDLAILSDQFLAEIQSMPQKNLAVELLRKLLNDEIKTRSARNAVQARSFGEMLQRAVLAYQNRSIETAQVIEQLIQLAKELEQAQQRGEQLGLTDAELAFYDALRVSKSAVEVMGDNTLAAIARELTEKMRANVTVDWTVREDARARLRALVRRVLRHFGYPPDAQRQATDTVLQQAELFAQQWAV